MTSNTINDAVTMAGGGETLLAGRYRVVRQLGQGGMGSVWLAEDTQLDGKLFAIKMLPSILVSNKRAYRQLKDEALVAMQLVHPNIVQIRAFEENNGNPFLVMDYIDGETLDDYLAEHTGTTGVPPVVSENTGPTGVPPVGSGSTGTTGILPVGSGSTGTTGILPVARGLPEADVLRLLKPIAAALDYAHSKGVVHRDVKPGNVMVAKDGTPYILDFGIAREIQETMTRVTGKLSSGTLLYMSPEQLNGDAPKPAQDIYSFAAMAYECLKGEPPFSRGQIEYLIDNDTPEPLAGASVQLARSVMAGLAKKPEDRPATCAGVLSGDVLTQSSRDAEGQRKREGGFGRVATCAEASASAKASADELVDKGHVEGGGRSPAAPSTDVRASGRKEHKVGVGRVLVVFALLVALGGGVWWWKKRQGSIPPDEGAKAVANEVLRLMNSLELQPLLATSP